MCQSLIRPPGRKFGSTFTDYKLILGSLMLGQYVVRLDDDTRRVPSVEITIGISWGRRQYAMDCKRIIYHVLS